jgi:hypothetical protein
LFSSPKVDRFPEEFLSDSPYYEGVCYLKFPMLSVGKMDELGESVGESLLVNIEKARELKPIFCLTNTI